MLTRHGKLKCMYYVYILDMRPNICLYDVKLIKSNWLSTVYAFITFTYGQINKYQVCIGRWNIPLKKEDFFGSISKQMANNYLYKIK